MFRFIFKLLILSLLAGEAGAGQVPPVVVEFFKSFAESQPEEDKPAIDAGQSTQYALWFFEGFTHPKGGIFTKSSLMRDAYTKGQVYWREHPSRRDDIFAGYGYAAIEQDGVLSRGFEKSAFKPDNLDDSLWWMTPLGNVAWREVGIEPPGFSPIRLHIVGYLSAEGEFGHLGAYKREVLVTSAVLSNAASP